MSVDQRNNPKLLIGLIGTLVVIVACIAGYLWLSTSTQPTKDQQELGSTIATQKSVVIDPKQQTTTEQVPAPTQTQTLVDDALLKDAIPENPSLAKEELAKLDDIQTQLNDQKKSLTQQDNDADALIKLKEEQIKLLEVQLAQGK